MKKNITSYVNTIVEDNKQKRWDDISSIDNGRWAIDRYAHYIIHINNGTMRYDYDRFDDHLDAILAEYHDFGTESGREAMQCAYADIADAKAVWNKCVALGKIDPKDYWG